VRTKKRKGERIAEDNRVEMYEEELRQLGRHKRAITLVGDAPPITFRPAPFVQACPEKLSRAANKGTPYVIDFQTAEAQYKSLGASKPTGPLSNPGQRAALFQPQTSLPDEIDEARAQRRPRVPVADEESLEV